jgi:hypothetical protein
MGEWLKPPDCNSGAEKQRWFESSSLHHKQQDCYMFYLYAVNRCSEAPADRREWWWLLMENRDRQPIEDWLRANRYPGYSYKLVTNPRPLKDCFYVAMELRSRSETARFLKQVGYKPM